MSQAHVYPIIFTFFLLFSTLPIYYYAPHMSLHDHMCVICLPSLYQTSLTYLMDLRYMFHMSTLPILVGLCALLLPDQPHIATPHMQPLHFRGALCSLFSLLFVFNLPVFTFRRESVIHKFHPFFRFSAFVSHLPHPTSHHITSHHIALHSTVFTCLTSPRANPLPPDGTLRAP